MSNLVLKGISAALLIFGASSIEAAPAPQRSKRFRSHQVNKPHFRDRRFGSYQIVYRTVREPGFYERVWIPPVSRVVCRRGIRVNVIVRPGYYKKVWRPGRVIRVPQRVWKRHRARPVRARRFRRSGC